MSSASSHDPEHRWRRTVEQRGRPVKLKVGRLLRDFGYEVLDFRAGDAIEDRLAQVGVHVRPPLDTVAGDAIITLELMMPGPGYQPSPTSDFPALPTSDFPAISERPFAAPDDAWPADPVRPRDVRRQGAENVESSPLVQAAVEAERRAREAYEQASAAAAQRIAALEREIAADREAAARARDERERKAKPKPRAQVEPPAPPAEPTGADALEPVVELAAAAGDNGHHDPAYVWHDAEPVPPDAPLVIPEEAPARRERTPWEADVRARRLRLGGLVLGLAALVALAAGGYVVGQGSEDPAARPQALTGPATRAGVGLRHPAGWERLDKAPRIPGLRFESPLALAPAGQSSTGIVAGLVERAVGSDLLPAGLRRLLPEDVPEPDSVLLGEIEALRYARLELVGYPDAVTLFAVPTAKGSAVIACHAPIEAGAFFADCERSAATLQLGGLPSQRLDGARALPLGPSRSYGERVAGAIETVGETIAGDGERLSKARTARGQATIARAIARSLTRAAQELDAAVVSARDQEGHAELVRSIGAGADAYEDLAAAARDADRGGYADASEAVRDAAERLRKAVAALRKLGYEG